MDRNIHVSPKNRDVRPQNAYVRPERAPVRQINPIARLFNPNVSPCEAHVRPENPNVREINPIARGRVYIVSRKNPIVREKNACALLFAAPQAPGVRLKPTSNKRYSSFKHDYYGNIRRRGPGTVPDLPH